MATNCKVDHLQLASNKILARLITCLVNEEFLKGYVVPASDVSHHLCKADAYGSWLIAITEDAKDMEGSYWIPLKMVPFTSEPAYNTLLRCLARPVIMLHPEELTLSMIKQLKGSVITDVHELRQVTKQLNQWYPDIDPDVLETVTQEMENSVLHQAAAFDRWYTSGPKRSLPSVEQSEAIEWEQSLVEGHPIHPMNMARFPVPPTQPIHPENDMLNVNVHFFALPRSKVTIRGAYEQLIAPLISNAKIHTDPEKEIIIPVHEVQIPHVLHKFPHARQLPFTRKARALLNLRTLIIEGLPEFNIKLPIGMKITSAMRTVSPWSTHIGPTFDPVARSVIRDKDLLLMCKELGSVVSSHSDPEIAKHLSCIIRQDPQHLVRSSKGGHEKVIVCAALLEHSSIDDKEFVVNEVFGLDTVHKREIFFDRYARTFLRAFVPTLLCGFSFEAHSQNCLARFAKSDETGEWEIVGFVIRDLGGIMVHQETLRRTSGVEMDVWCPEEASQLAQSIEDVHKMAHHSMIQNHLQMFARALGVHHNGIGWDVVRDELERILPVNDCPTRCLWLEQGATAKRKALMRMRLQGLYRHAIYVPLPNLITVRSHCNHD